MSVDLDDVEPGSVLVYEHGFSTSTALLLEVTDDEITFAGAVSESGFEPPENIHTEARSLHEVDEVIRDMSDDAVERAFGFTYDEYENGDVVDEAEA